jgi:excisionase family DNA binding protein
MSKKVSPKQLVPTAVVPPDALILTVPETAKLLRRSVSCIRAWILQKRIPHVKIGAGVFIRRTDIDQMLAQVIPADKKQAII